MDELQIGMALLAISGASNGIELRREPSTNAETTDGNNNVILVMPPDSLVVLESVEDRINEGHSWYSVRYVQDEIDTTGWVIGDCLQPAIIPVTGDPDFPATNIQYNSKVLFGGQSVPLLNCPPRVLGRVGLVTFNLGNETIATTKEFWNVAANNDKFKL